MDAESTNIEPERRTRLHQIEPDPEVEHLRADMLEAENRIVEDVDRLKETLAPDRIANYLVTAIREELLARIKTVDWQKLGDVRVKIKTSIQEHPYASAALGLGISSLIFYGLVRYQKGGRLQYLEREETGITEKPEIQEQKYEYVVSPSSAGKKEISSESQLQYNVPKPQAIVGESVATSGSDFQPETEKRKQADGSVQQSLGKSMEGSTGKEEACE